MRYDQTYQRFAAAFDATCANQCQRDRCNLAAVVHGDCECAKAAWRVVRADEAEFARAKVVPPHVTSARNQWTSAPPDTQLVLMGGASMHTRTPDTLAERWDVLTDYITSTPTAEAVPTIIKRGAWHECLGVLADTLADAADNEHARDSDYVLVANLRGMLAALASLTLGTVLTIHCGPYVFTIQPAAT